MDEALPDIERGKRAYDLLYEELGSSRYPVVLKAISRLFYGRHDSNQAMVHVRLSHYWMVSGKKRRALWVRDRLRRNFGCYVSPKAEIGRRLKLPHPVGIVIGDGVRIGDGCTIFQHVTLGGARAGDGAISRYPSIGAGTTIFTGACVLGPVNVASHATIGANAVVMIDVPRGVTAVGVPASLKRRRTDDLVENGSLSTTQDEAPTASR